MPQRAGKEIRRIYIEKEEKKQLDDILKAHDYNKTSVIAIMQDIQKIYHYLPQEVLTYIAGELGLSEAKVYGVATFYENFFKSQRENM